METNSKKVRNISINMLSSFIEKLKYSEGIYGKSISDTNQIYISFWESIKYSQLDEFLNFTCKLPYIDSYSFNMTKVLLTLVTIQLYTDLLKKIRYKSKDNYFSNEDIMTLKNIEDVATYDDIISLFNNQEIIIEALNALKNFDKLSAYKKILQFKSLTEKDKEKLNSINPLFLQEYESFDVQIDDLFIINQIKKWFKAYPNNHDVAYIETAKFLIELYKINGDVHFLNLLCSDIDCVNCACEYNISNSSNNSTYDQEKIHVMGVPLSRKLIEKMLVIYYDKYNFKLDNKHKYELVKDTNNENK